MKSKGLIEKEIFAWRMARWKARTDLGFLAREVLGYKDVVPEIHQPVIDTLQKFTVPAGAQFYEHDAWTGSTWSYKPLVTKQQLAGKRRVLILDARGFLKCLRTKELLRLENGSYDFAENLKVGSRIAAQIEENSFVPGFAEVTGIERQKQPCYKITFRSGRVLETSHNHPFRTISGWTMAEDLLPNDRIAVHGHTPQPVNAKYIPDSEFIGWMLGDGSISNQAITQYSEFFRKCIILAAQRANFSAKEFKYGKALGVRIQGARQRFRELGLMDAKSGNKFIPQEYFRADNKSLAELLYGLYMSDGTATKSGIFLTSKSEQLCRDIQRALLRFNIWSHVRSHLVIYRGHYLKFWQVRITSAKQVSRFVVAIGWDKLFHFIPAKISNPNVNTVPKTWRNRYGKYLFGHGKKPSFLKKRIRFNTYDIGKDNLRPFVEALKDEELKFLCTDEIYWDFVENVEYIGEQETIAIETTTKTFCVDDVITHNTTINAQAHTIQWIINYPHVAIAIFQSNIEKAELILKEIKNHFQHNIKFRQLFPEHCPQKRILDFGTKGEFTTLARPPAVTRRESTVMTFSIEKGTAGLHFDVMKFSDIVEPENVKTPERIEAVKKAFYMAENLLVSPAYWIDVEGTRYSFQDLYGDLIEQWKQEERDAVEHEYGVFVRSGLKRLDDKKYLERFTPDTLDETKYPFALDKDGKRISCWPIDSKGDPRFPIERYEAMERKDPYIFSCQILNSPRGGIDGQLIFEVGPNKPLRISRDLFNKNVRAAYYTMTVDTAETVGKRSNYSAIIICAWDASGQCWVREIVHGKFLPVDLEQKILTVYKKYKPISVKIEETGFVRGLMTGLRRLLDIQGITMPIDFIKRENQTAKTERIYNTLNPWYENNWIRFVDPPEKDEEGWKAFNHLLEELKTFPLGRSDDILDALADQFQGKEWFGREIPRPNVEQANDRLVKQWLKIEDPFDSFEDTEYILPLPG